MFGQAFLVFLCENYIFWAILSCFAIQLLITEQKQYKFFYWLIIFLGFHNMQLLLLIQKKYIFKYADLLLSDNQFYVYIKKYESLKIMEKCKISSGFFKGKAYWIKLFFFLLKMFKSAWWWLVRTAHHLSPCCIVYTAHHLSPCCRLPVVEPYGWGTMQLPYPQTQNEIKMPHRIVRK